MFARPWEACDAERVWVFGQIDSRDKRHEEALEGRYRYDNIVDDAMIGYFREDLDSSPEGDGVRGLSSFSRDR